MSLNHVILGLLNHNEMTGYDLKKMIQKSDFMYWSGNNNQIYKALSELNQNGFVTSEVHYQESSPNKKVYAITDAGKAVLKDWLLSPLEEMEIRKPFLMRLACAKDLTEEELLMLLNHYEEQINIQLMMTKNHAQIHASNDRVYDQRHEKHELISRFIIKNVQKSYEGELLWIRDFKKAFAEH